MTNTKRKLAKLAAKVHGDLLGNHDPPQVEELPKPLCDRVNQLATRIDLARRQHWERAARHLSDSYQRAISELVSLLGDIKQGLSDYRIRPSIPSNRTILEDLLALEEEFPEVAWSYRKSQLHVTTEPIELQGFYLGPFLALEQSFYVVNMCSELPAGEGEVSNLIEQII